MSWWSTRRKPTYSRGEHPNSSSRDPNQEPSSCEATVLNITPPCRTSTSQICRSPTCCPLSSLVNKTVLNFNVYPLTKSKVSKLQICSCLTMCQLDLIPTNLHLSYHCNSFNTYNKCFISNCVQRGSDDTFAQKSQL